MPVSEFVNNQSKLTQLKYLALGIDFLYPALNVVMDQFIKIGDNSI